MQAVKGVLLEKLVRRGVSTKALTWERVEPAAGGRVRQNVALQQGIPIEKAREIVKIMTRTIYEVDDIANAEIDAAELQTTLRVLRQMRDNLKQALARR